MLRGGCGGRATNHVVPGDPSLLPGSYGTRTGAPAEPAAADAAARGAAASSAEPGAGPGAEPRARGGRRCCAAADRTSYAQGGEGCYDVAAAG